MIQINRNKTKDKIVFTIGLDSDIELMGLLRPLKQSGLIPKQQTDLPQEQHPDENGYITGTTTSKFYLIEQSFPLNQVVYGEEIFIRGMAIKGAVTDTTEEFTGYYLAVDEDVRIEYRDTENGTFFKFKPTEELTYANDVIFLLEYFELIDEPKLKSTLFIDRGINNVFESLIRLKTVNSMQELKQTGFGYFNLKDSEII